MMGELSALGSALCWALTSVFLRHLQSRTSALSLNALRCLIASLLASIAILVLGRETGVMAIPPRSLAFLMASVLMGLGLGDTAYFYGLKSVGVARALPATSVYPIYTAILAALLLSEPITARMIVGTALVMAGIVLVMLPARVLLRQAQVVTPRPRAAGEESRIGILMVLLAPLCWAASTTLLKAGLQEVDSLVATAARMGMAAILLTVIAGFTHPGLQIRHYRGAHLWGTILAGVISGISALLFLTGVQLAGAAKAATLNSTSPLFGVPLSILTKERVTPQILLGTAISIVGIWLVVTP